MKINQVLDYDSPDSPLKGHYKPRVLHGDDHECHHPENQSYRDATPEEMRTLRECKSCQARMLGEPAPPQPDEWYDENGVKVPLTERSKSVRAIPTAFETNRRRH